MNWIFKGWDIQKVLRLMLKSNSSINEYLQSPIHYISDEIFEKELFNLAASQFNSQKLPCIIWELQQSD